MEIILANPRGFCAGVDRAISIVDRALDLFGAPIYVRHEVVHNKFVVDGLKDRGAIFVDELFEVPDDNTVIFSAHGVSKAVRQQAKDRGLKVFDATCPLVTKVHMEVSRTSRKNIECILIGHAGHPEVEGTMGQYESEHGGIYLVESVADVATLEVKDPTQLYYCSQTTLSIDDTSEVIDALRNKFALIKGPRKDDICYATQNRQDAVRTISAQVDLLLVVGAKNSSNSNRLRELSEKLGTPSYLIDTFADIQPQWLENVNKIGVTAGASAPAILIQQVIDALKDFGGQEVIEYPGREENTVFAVPIELR
ncbi:MULTISPECIES: 4-hydroxy-3-methylbut-2-enyl diphosphate reductase [unclassified Colwellia]|jgi:4-hydroxy-3-methylbut-2-enyl diphosphate reductase|uniref:4-hydroxy-3-methylbut-2-enyl diphosphate reductase n=1 Tax=unclassified Colwellia TaxID=196834 RepID=UPI0015F76319|nr:MULTISPECIES: 4-hydroxy-3-methylbut-2-enyl diphosphate reductase [unclassified Colwellia]MBA6335595.1 4-hydroxy-3-methylbut-2-enyl diphosphate reductase [Colwellia sp. BRX8-7]MBA6349990.1 4-hydroxy-3-methylbut-2-enyl diphosphate reductase [Colwellia sp. BRX8-9]MBA6353952.1 4-hydroxy-3-methylbut-2-enyl diphosphate reductase [Colwellia sp. BRX9-1]MBA6356903.1 4-hydroxy-3-methylbut-2-enyl diphosphate reductase [Colwellia sp. BRX8-3]MBA6360610.1 4-hydroxy-3-methylbut-2-enyl diphosphate reductas